jgi:hypothetical protein
LQENFKNSVVIGVSALKNSYLIFDQRLRKVGFAHANNLFNKNFDEGNFEEEKIVVAEKEFDDPWAIFSFLKWFLALIGIFLGLQIKENFESLKFRFNLLWGGLKDDPKSARPQNKQKPTQKQRGAFSRYKFRRLE